MYIKLKPRMLTITRIKHGLSQRELAKKASLSNGYIAQLEKETRFPTPRTAQKICQALGCEFDDLFEIVNDEESLAG